MDGMEHKLPAAPEQGCGHVPEGESVNYPSCPHASLLLHPMLQMNSCVSLAQGRGARACLHLCVLSVWEDGNPDCAWDLGSQNDTSGSDLDVH